ncbi:putative RNA-directed DNA polymerase from transposon X-element, partial [Blattella germanica]
IGTSLIHPIWLYSGFIWGSASPSQIKRIQTYQNRCLRLITNAIWHIRNSMLHTDLQVPDVTTTLHQNYLNLQYRFVNHRNPLLQ